jgi:Pyruvate kinase
VIAKIERKVALQDIDGIIAASDAVMVARGDLGIEAELEEVPFLQKEIIRKCNDQGRPVITATQMLESMVNSPQPTRAEVTDVANAVLDGSDALMLSEETAVGQHPVRALEEMVAIAGKAEKRLHEFSECRRPLPEAGASMAESLSRAAVDVSQSIRAGLIVVPTQNAQSVSWLSRLRPGCVVAGITTSEAVFKKMILFWGVYPILIRKISSLPETLRQCVAAVKARRLVRKNDTMVIMLTKDNQLFSTDIMEVRRVD